MIIVLCLFKQSQLSVYSQCINIVCFCFLVEVAGVEHTFKNSLRYGYRQAIPCLLSGLAVIANDFERLWKTLQTKHFSAGKSAFTVYQQVVIRRSGAKGTGIRICADVSSLVFVPDGRFVCRLLFAQSFSPYMFRCIIRSIYIVFQNFNQRLHWYFALWPIEANSVSKSDNKNSFSLLW